MYSSYHQAVHRVKNGLMSQRKLYLIFVLWSCFIWFQFVKNFCMTYNFYHLPVSAADALISSQTGMDFGIKIYPFVCLIVLRCKLSSLHTQALIRFHTKEKFLITQIQESSLYAFGFSAFQCILNTIIALSQGLPLICWDALDNILYIKTNLLVTESFMKVFGMILFFFYLKYMVIFAVLDIVIWIPQLSLLPWIIIITFAGSELPIFQAKNLTIFHSFFAVQYELWKSPSKHILLYLTLLTIIVLTYFIGNQLIRRKDIYRI